MTQSNEVQIIEFLLVIENRLKNHLEHFPILAENRLRKCTRSANNERVVVFQHNTNKLLDFGLFQSRRVPWAAFLNNINMTSTIYETRTVAIEFDYCIRSNVIKSPFILVPPFVSAKAKHNENEKI